MNNRKKEKKHKGQQIAAVLAEQMINQVKAVVQFFCCSEVSAAEQLIQKGLDDIRKKHGKKALTLQKTQSLFD